MYAGAFPERSTHRHRKSPLDRFLPYFQQQVQAGCTNAKELWRAIHAQGFPLGYNVVNAWLRAYLATLGRRSSARESVRREAFTVLMPTDIPIPTTSTNVTLSPRENDREPLKSPRHLAWLLIREPTNLNRSEHQMLAFIRQEKAIDEAYLLVQSFVAMVRNHQGDGFDEWLHACRNSGIPDLQSFADGLQRDYSGVKAALLLPFSNGPVEGNINRLKFIKRSMYGRGSFHLLRQRVLPAA